MEFYIDYETMNSNFGTIHVDNSSVDYKDFNIIEKDFAYAQRFGKNKDHSGASVKHLYITNYSVVPVDEVAQGTSNPLLDAL